MDLEELRKRHSDLLVDLLRDTSYPSAAIMQRVEEGIRDPRAALEHVEMLIERCERDRFPSLPLLDRISGLIKALERVAWRERAAS